MFKRLKKYLKVWYLLTISYFAISLSSRLAGTFLLLGKLIRFFFFLLFLVLLTSRTQKLAGYTLWQVVFFFLTFNLIDISAQLFLREVYRFRSLVVSGNFDLILAKPINPLFRILAGGADVLDLITIFPLLAFIIYTVTKIGPITSLGMISYILLYLNAMLIAIALHTIVAAIGVLTTEVDNTIFLYRDLTSMARIPIDFYRFPLQVFLTFVVPVGIMITFPAKAIMGLLAFPWIFVAFVFGGTLFWVSLKFWNWSLTKYSSASS